MAAVPIVNFFLTRRAFGVSGHYSAVVDALRFRDEEESAPVLDQAALLEALRAETAFALGPDALLDDEVPSAERSELASIPAPVRAFPRPTLRTHVLFLVSLVLGGSLAAFATSSFEITRSLRGETFSQVVTALPLPAPLLLVLGGLCVGFGTRMAGGCTSGHGLCGMSQFQLGSMLNTACFFGAAVLMSFALGALL